MFKNRFKSIIHTFSQYIIFHRFWLLRLTRSVIMTMSFSVVAAMIFGFAWPFCGSQVFFKIDCFNFYVIFFFRFPLQKRCQHRKLIN